MESNDNKELYIETKITRTGLTVKSNTAAANVTDQILGELGKALLYGARTLTPAGRVTNSKEKTLIEKRYDAAIEEATSEGEAAHLRREYMVESYRHEQAEIEFENKAHVLENTQNILEDKRTEGKVPPEQSVNGDWLNSFGDQVKNASSDEARKLWAKVLAAEVLEPDSVSKRTLRFLADLSAKDAKAIEDAIEDHYVGSDLFVWRLSDNGQYDIAKGLLNAGFASDISNNLTNTRTVQDKSVEFRSNDTSLVLEMKTKNAQLVFPIALLSHEGAELLRLNDYSISEKAARYVVDTIKGNLERATYLLLGEFVSSSSRKIINQTVLFEAQQPAP